MSKLQELIKELCPNGVEFMRMDEVFEMRNGYTPSKANDRYWNNGTIPWFRMEDIRQNGRILSDSIQHITKEAVKGGRLFHANSFIIATTATIGEHALVIADSLANQQFTNLTIRKSLVEQILVKYLFYYLFVVGEWCKNNTNISGFASVDMSKFKKLEIPIPPLEVQNEIVRILDTFTSHAAELQAELQARKEQYEYYRNKLLTFDENDEGVKWMKLGEICSINRGVRVVKNDLCTKGHFPVFQNSLTPLGYYDKNNYPSDTTFIISAGAAGEVGYAKTPIWAADDCLCVIPSKDILNNKFVYYCLVNNRVFLTSKVRKASVPRLSRKTVEQFPVPVPPLSEQQYIVSILDKFESLVNNLTTGLPAEIAAVQEQYEYYRNKLLTFKRIS